MSNLIFAIDGCRGRSIKIFDNKVVVETKVSLGSIVTGNATDGVKTVFYKDIVGIQFKKAGFLIGYIQLETSSAQMNNQSSNMFSENTFTFDETNEMNNVLAEAMYNFICDRVEEVKYDIKVIETIPDFESLKSKPSNITSTVNNETNEDSGEGGLKCELCGNRTDHLTYVQIKDSYGTRYRNVCDSCLNRTDIKITKK